MGLRIGTYSQVEYVTAAMLARHVKPGGARVLQVGTVDEAVALQALPPWRMDVNLT